MPYRKVPPADDEDMRKKRYLGHHTICEKLREIWRESDDPNIKMKAKEAMGMAKRMQAKLKIYRDGTLNEDTKFALENTKDDEHQELDL